MIKHLGLTCEDAMIVILGLSLPLKAVGRDATIVADWLRKQPTVTHVARDHAGAYSTRSRRPTPTLNRLPIAGISSATCAKRWSDCLSVKPRGCARRRIRQA